MAGVFLMCLSACSVMAQGGGGGGGGKKGGGRNAGGATAGFDPATIATARLEGLKTQLEITDDNEWAALQPLIQKVGDAQTAVRGDSPQPGRAAGGAAGGRGGRGGAAAPGGAVPSRGGALAGGASQEITALQRAVDNNASKEDTKTVLDNLASVRKAHRDALDKAQANLRMVVTVRQEAILTLNGYL
jgi:hypothetical protein